MIFLPLHETNYFRFRKKTFFSNLFFWFEQRTGGVTVGGFKKKNEKSFFFPIQTNNLPVAIHETHCGTTQLPHHDTLFIIIFLYFADFRSDFLHNLYGGTCTPNSPNPKLPGIVISRLSGR
jgi:hypothetical protein